MSLSTFQVDVEENADAVRGHSNLATAVDVNNAKCAQNTHQKRALQHRSVIREHVVIRTLDCE